MAAQATQTSLPSIPLDIIMVSSSTQTTDIQMAFSGNKVTHIITDLSCSRAMYVDMALGSSPGLESTMPSGGCTGSSCLPVPGSSPTFPHSVQTLCFSHSLILHHTFSRHSGTHGGCLGVFLPAAPGQPRQGVCLNVFLPATFRLFRKSYPNSNYILKCLIHYYFNLNRTFSLKS